MEHCITILNSPDQLQELHEKVASLGQENNDLKEKVSELKALLGDDDGDKSGGTPTKQDEQDVEERESPNKDS